jgi:hypothetical protein
MPADQFDPSTPPWDQHYGHSNPKLSSQHIGKPHQKVLPKLLYFLGLLPMPRIDTADDINVKAEPFYYLIYGVNFGNRTDRSQVYLTTSFGVFQMEILDWSPTQIKITVYKEQFGLFCFDKLAGLHVVASSGFLASKGIHMQPYFYYGFNTAPPFDKEDSLSERVEKLAELAIPFHRDITFDKDLTFTSALLPDCFKMFKFGGSPTEDPLIVMGGYIINNSVTFDVPGYTDEKATVSITSQPTVNAQANKLEMKVHIHDDRLFGMHVVANFTIKIPWGLTFDQAAWGLPSA